MTHSYHEAFKAARRAMREGLGLTIATDAGNLTYFGAELEEFMDRLAPGESFTILGEQPMSEEPDSSDYAWMITADHLADEGEEGDKWERGPGCISTRQEAMLPAGAALRHGYQRHIFRLYDDDGNLYYTGRAIFREPTTEALSAPLVDWGTTWAGATLIRWQGHPEWECENC